MKGKPLGYRISEISRLFHKKVKSVANDNGMSSTYFHIVSYLKHHKDENITQKDICDFMKMKPSTISLTLQGMEHEGFIKRIKSECDCRCTYVKLTDLGEELDKKVRKYFQTVEDMMINTLTEEEYNLFIECLNKFSKVLEV